MRFITNSPKTHQKNRIKKAATFRQQDIILDSLEKWESGAKRKISVLPESGSISFLGERR
jgi:hypothetical protein